MTYVDGEGDEAIDNFIWRIALLILGMTFGLGISILLIFLYALLITL